MTLFHFLAEYNGFGLVCEGKLADVVLGFDALEPYLKGTAPDFGCIVGPVANRIKDVKFTLNGAEYSLPINKPPCLLNFLRNRSVAIRRCPYYCWANADKFRDKRVIELGSGYGLAGLVIAVVTEALKVVITDGNPQVVDYIQRNIDANHGVFGGSKVKSVVLHWNHPELEDIADSFDIIVASDCTFFKEFHKDLAQTIRVLLREESSSEAILLSPRRGDSLDKFLVEIKHSGLHFTVTEMYNSEVRRLHQNFMNGDNSWPNYDKDHCYTLLMACTKDNQHQSPIWAGPDTISYKS